MKVNITIDNEELYEQLLAKLKEDGISLKQFFADSVNQYLNPPSIVKPVDLADAFITELAVQLVEQKLRSLPKNKFADTKANDYLYINQACLDLLSVIPSRYAQHLLEV